MGTRENKVETYLRTELKKLGGDSRKWVSPGRDGVPDQICFHIGIFFCEVKTDDGVLSTAQEREHERLRKLGATVVTVWGQRGVNLLIFDLIDNGKPTEKYYGKA